MARQHVAVLVDPLRKLLSRGAKGHAANMLSKLHAADVARLFDYLRVEQRPTVFELMLRESPERAADLIRELDVSVAAGLLGPLPDAQVAAILAELDSDDAAEIIPAMPEEQADRVLHIMNDAASEPIEGLLAYEEETAGRIMSPEVFALEEHVKVGDAIAALRHSRSEDLEMIFYLYVVDDRRHLVGVCSLRELLLAGPQTALQDLMNPRVTSVNTHTDQEDVARLVARYDLLALPVVDDENKLVGIITVDDIIDIIREEESEDMLLMAGVGEGTEEGVLAASLTRSIILRLPWLFAAWIGGMIASQIITDYQGSMDQLYAIALAAFIPIVAGMGGNAGTQSATIVVRGLATGKITAGGKLWIIFKEVRVAFVMGLLLGGLAAGFVTLLKGDWHMGVIVGIAIAASMSIAATVGTTMPMILHRLGVDPAVATGPFVTTSIDVIGVLTYFSIAQAVFKLAAGG
jgi:magnesium transporter